MLPTPEVGVGEIQEIQLESLRFSSAVKPWY
jgi:hypothetical protein